MQTQGQVTLYCDRNGKLQTIDFLVVDVPGDKPPLLTGKDTQQALGYLKTYADKIKAVEDEIPRIVPTFPPLGKLTEKDSLQHYSNIFKIGCGKPLGRLMHIELDPSVTCPVAKLNRVDEELNRLCEVGIRPPITQTTDWLSNMMVKEKQNGKLRICINQGPNGHYCSKFMPFSIASGPESISGNNTNS